MKKVLFLLGLLLAFPSAAVEIAVLTTGVVGKADGTAIRVEGTDAVTTTALDVLRVRRNVTAGVGGTGTGAVIGFQLEDSTGAIDTNASITAVATDATAASEDADLVFSTMDAGGVAQERARFGFISGSIFGLRLTQDSGTTGSIYAGTYNQEIAFGVSSLYANGNTYYFNTRSDGGFGWSSAASIDGNSTIDTRLYRHSAGVLKLGDDTAGSIRGFMGGGAAVASAAALPLPTGRVFHVTGTTSITSITSTNFEAGVCITLVFDGILTLTDGGNIAAAGNFVTTADDTWSACYTGTVWYETSRSVN